MTITKKSLLSIITPVLVWSIILLGAFLRTHDADIFPIDNNDDGLFYVWTGNTILDSKGSATSHTIFEVGNESLIWRSQYHDFDPIKRFGYKLTSPWFDHPPLATIFIALPARILGYTQFEQIPHIVVRYPAIIASIITMFLTFHIARAIYGRKTAYLSLIFLATIPYFAFAHKQSYLENILTPVFLLFWLAVIKLQIKTSKLWITALILTLFATGWMKIIGFAVPAMAVVWFARQKNYLLMKISLFTGVLSLGSYLVYGLASGGQVFLDTISNQGERGAFVSSFFNSFTNLKFYGGFADGMYLFGFLAVIFLTITVAKTPKYQLTAWLFSSWLIALFMLTGRWNNSSWYRYQLIPFIAIAIGKYLYDTFKNPSILRITPLLLLGFTGFDLLEIDIPSSVFRAAVFAVFGLLAALYVFKSRLSTKTLQITLVVIIFAITALNIYTILNYPEFNCSRHDCLQPTRVQIVLNE